MADIDSLEYTDFVKRRTRWIECLSGKDCNSIIRQVYRMVSDAATFHVVNEARRLAPKQGGRVQLNGLIHGLIDDGFVASQIMALRRLADAEKLNGKRGVYSLVSLLRDMKDHAGLLTREHFFAVNSLPMKGEAALYCAWEEQHAPASGTPDPRMADDLKLEQMEEMEELHEVMDWLAGVNKRTRTWQDAVREEVFQRLEDKVMKVCEDAQKYANKFVAHAATPDSRQEVNADEIEITLEHLGQAHKAICGIINCIDKYVVTGTSNIFLPRPSYDQFEYIERPLVSQQDIGRLCEVWQEYAREADKWGQCGLDEFKAELGG